VVFSFGCSVSGAGLQVYVGSVEGLTRGKSDRMLNLNVFRLCLYCSSCAEGQRSANDANNELRLEQMPQRGVYGAELRYCAYAMRAESRRRRSLTWDATWLRSDAPLPLLAVMKSGEGFAGSQHVAAAICGVSGVLYGRKKPRVEWLGCGEQCVFVVVVCLGRAVSVVLNDAAVVNACQDRSEHRRGAS
jgi:hypothetical protein